MVGHSFDSSLDDHRLVSHIYDTQGIISTVQTPREILDYTFYSIVTQW